MTLTVFEDEALSSSNRFWWRGARYLVTFIYFAFSIIPVAGQKSKDHVYTAEKWRVSRKSELKQIQMHLDLHMQQEIIDPVSHTSVPNQSEMSTGRWYL